MGAPGLDRGEGCRPLYRQGLLMMVFEAAGLFGHAFGFKAAREGLRRSRGGVRLGRPQTPLGEAERVPAQAEAVTQRYDSEGERHDQQGPAGRGQHPQERQPPHGNTFRSSSKCGPSRSLGQSPPQTMAVPCRTAAALKAAAMRG